MHEGAVLITGGARRIGAVIARTLHGAGARVVLHCNRSRDEAERLAASFEASRPRSTAIVQGDLLDYASLARIVAEAAAAFGGLAGLVNNASSFRRTPVGTITAADWDELIGSNVRAALFLAQAAAPHLKATRGAIVNIVDIHAERPLKEYVVYSIAKSAVAGLTRSLALELGPEVRVNGVAPGAILWPEKGEHFVEAERERIVAQTPLKRTGTPEDVAGAVKYLLLDAPFVTGQVLAVDGGRGLWL